jgi:hypothetical protein
MPILVLPAIARRDACEVLHIDIGTNENIPKKAGLSLEWATKIATLAFVLLFLAGCNRIARSWYLSGYDRDISNATKAIERAPAITPTSPRHMPREAAPTRKKPAIAALSSSSPRTNTTACSALPSKIILRSCQRSVCPPPEAIKSFPAYQSNALCHFGFTPKGLDKRIATKLASDTKKQVETRKLLFRNTLI